MVDRFFVHGTLQRPCYGGYPALQFNTLRYPEAEIQFPNGLQRDAGLISEALKIGIFHYGPRFWMFGEIEPLQALLKSRTRPKIIKRILTEYPVTPLRPADLFYRLRVDPKKPADPTEYDSPPAELRVSGRLNAPGQPVLYGSQDLEVCIHECRATVEDSTYRCEASTACF